MTLVCRHCGSGDIDIIDQIDPIYYECMECGKHGTPIDAGDYHDRMEVKGGIDR